MRGQVALPRDTQGYLLVVHTFRRWEGKDLKSPGPRATSPGFQ